MEKILTKQIDYTCKEIQQTTGSIMCTKYEKKVDYIQNQQFIDAAIKRINYVDYFISTGLILIFTVLLIKKFLLR